MYLSKDYIIHFYVFLRCPCNVFVGVPVFFDDWGKLQKGPSFLKRKAVGCLPH